MRTTRQAIGASLRPDCLAHQMAGLTIEQAAALLKHRCKIIRFDGEISDVQLFSGSPAACLPILRFVFLHFSSALSKFFVDVAGHVFVESMDDEELVAGIIRVWPRLSPHSPIGPITVTKMLQRNMWGRDRLIFTLQSIFVCYHKHKALVSQADEEFMASSGFSWTSTTPRQQFGPSHQELVGTDSERERSQLAWMAEAYREQMATLPELPPGQPVRDPEIGAAEQQKWIDEMLRRQAGGHAAGDESLSEPIDFGLTIDMLVEGPMPYVQDDFDMPIQGPMPYFDGVQDAFDKPIEGPMPYFDGIQDAFDMPVEGPMPYVDASDHDGAQHFIGPMPLVDSIHHNADLPLVGPMPYVDVIQEHQQNANVPCVAPIQGSAPAECETEGAMSDVVRDLANDLGLSVVVSSSSSSNDQLYESARTSSTTSFTSSSLSLRLAGGGGPVDPDRFHLEDAVLDSNNAMLTADARDVVAAQLERVGQGHVVTDAPSRMRRGSSARKVFARHYQSLMSSLKFPKLKSERTSDQSDDSDRSSFDDAVFEVPFIADDATIRRSRADIRSAENLQHHEGPRPRGVSN